MIFSDHANTLLQKFYMRPDEKTPIDAFKRAATCFSKGDAALAQRLVEYVSKGWFMFASPVLSNAVYEGEKVKGLPISCFLAYVPDSLEGLIEHSKEIRWLSVKGGGVGGHWSSVRSASDISPGVIPFIKTVDSDMEAYRQGRTRKGSYAAYLDISHPDIMEFLNIRVPTGGDTYRKCFTLHNAINITDDFMKAVVEGTQWNLIDPNTKQVVNTVDARELFTEIVRVRFRTGEPYLNFIDTANKALNPYQYANGLRIKGSNLCVAPETKIFTIDGYKPIASLEGQEVKVWNGVEWSDTTIYKTGVNKELVRVTFSDGASIDCTPEHRFYIQEAYGKKPVMYEAKDLYVGAKLEKFDLPLFLFFPDYTNSRNNPYSLGFYAGDGNENYTFSWIYPEKHCVIPRLKSEWIKDVDCFGRIRWGHGSIPNKFNVPFSFNKEERIEWLAGLFDADGCVIKSDNCDNIQLVSVKPNFLREIKLMLQEMGVPCSVSLRREKGAFLLPTNDGTGGKAEYDCQEAWMLNINGEGVKRLLSLGLKTERLVFQEVQNPQRDCQKFVTVVSVERTGRISDTYCCTEPERNRVMFNGILTGNCNEIHLVTDEQRTAVCCLSSVNLEYFDEWKDTNMVQDLIVMLDNVLQFFIDNAPPELDRAVFSAVMERSLGLGAMGYHSYLQRKGLSWNDWRVPALNMAMFSRIKEQAVVASQKLAQERGEPEDIKGSGMRNAHLLAVAPNANSSILLDTSPSIEPWFANAYTTRTRAGTYLVKNKYLEKLLEAKGKNTDEVWKDIINHKGSVQHLDFLTEDEKEVYKTAYEIDQRGVVTAAAHRQPYICQGQSVNLFFPAGSDINYVVGTHIKAWKEGLKGLYYLRTESTAKADVVSFKIERNALKDSEACVACEG